MKQLFKKITRPILIGIACIGISAGAFLASAVPPNFGPSPVINSSSTTNTVVNFPYWPQALVGNALTTNFTKIDVSNFREFALQFTCASTNTTTTSNVTWVVCESIDGFAPTNAVGTSVNYEIISYVTNTLNGVTPVTTVANYAPQPKSASTWQSADNGVAGTPTIYVGWVNVPTLSGLTNYTVRVFGKPVNQSAQ